MNDQRSYLTDVPRSASAAKWARLLPAMGLALCGYLTMSSPVLAQVMGPSMPAGDRPAVSPYLNMIDNGFNFSGVSNYQTLVRPLIEQNEATMQQGAAIRQLQKQISGPQGAYRPRGSTSLRSTGHSTRFMNYSHYYSSAGRQPLR